MKSLRLLVASLPLLVAVALAAPGCSDGLPLPNNAAAGTDGGTPSDDGGAVLMPVDAGDNGAPSDVYPAPFPAPPQAIRYNGGRVLAAPRFVPVFFSGDDMATATKLIDFTGKIGASAFWKQTTAEYGVGPGTAAPAVMLAEVASGTIDDSKIKSWLTAKLNSDDPAFPAVGTDDIYILNYPSGVTITLTDNGAVSRSCRDFGAYHGNVRLDNNHKLQRVAYAVIPRCRAFGGGSVTDQLTVSTSHELTEAATDPYPSNGPAYAQVDDEHINWMMLLGGGEVSDLCQNLPDANVRPDDLAPYAVQRGWSNAAAMGGHDPCVPAPAAPYFAAAPELPDYVEYTVGSSIVGVLGVQIPVGQKRTITLDLFSDGPTKPFLVNARNTGRGTYLSFSLDRNLGVNGEKVHLTISSNSEAPNFNANFVVTATLNNVVHSWYAVVGQQP